MKTLSAEYWNNIITSFEQTETWNERNSIYVYIFPLLMMKLTGARHDNMLLSAWSLISWKVMVRICLSSCHFSIFQASLEFFMKDRSQVFASILISSVDCKFQQNPVGLVAAIILFPLLYFTPTKLRIEFRIYLLNFIWLSHFFFLKKKQLLVDQLNAQNLIWFLIPHV